MLLLDQLGHLVGVPTNAVHRSLLPPRDLGLKQQTPNPVEGTDVPDEVLQRLEGIA